MGTSTCPEAQLKLLEEPNGEGELGPVLELDRSVENDLENRIKVVEDLHTQVVMALGGTFESKFE